MKSYKVLLGIVFTFLSIECQALIDVTEILKEGGIFGGPSKVRVSRFEKGDITDFSLENDKIQGFKKDKQDLFVQSLFNDDNANIFFTYAILEQAMRKLDVCTTQSRAATLFGIIGKNEQIKTALESNTHKVIILDRKQITLGASIESRRASWSPAGKAPCVPEMRDLSEDDIAKIGKLLGVDFNARSIFPTIPFPSTFINDLLSASAGNVEAADLDASVEPWEQAKQTIVTLVDIVKISRQAAAQANNTSVATDSDVSLVIPTGLSSFTSDLLSASAGNVEIADLDTSLEPWEQAKQAVETLVGIVDMSREAAKKAAHA